MRNLRVLRAAVQARHVYSELARSWWVYLCHESLLYLTILFIKNIIRVLFNIIRYYLTGIIVKKMVLLLKTARAGHPPSRRPPATAHYRTHRVSPAPCTPRRRAWGQRQPQTPVFSQFSPFYQNYPHHKIIFFQLSLINKIQIILIKYK